MTQAPASAGGPGGAGVADRPELLRGRAIGKRFGMMRALDAVDLALLGGEIHALVGANGAGKSTLSRILCGHMRPDEGEILIRSERRQLSSPGDALAAGVAMVTQETTLAPDLPVIENVFLPRMARARVLSRRSLVAEADRIVADFGLTLNFSLSDRVGDLSIADRQIVEILKALAGAPDVIFFDEPTTSLSPYESERLLETMAALAGRGRAVVLVSHRMEEIFAVSNRVTVLREGRAVASGIEIGSLDPGGLIKLMVGRELSDVYSKHLAGVARAAGAPPAVRVTNLKVPPAVHDVSFTIGEGEIVGLGGLVGAGRTEIAEALYGLRGIAAGSIELHGKPYRPTSSAAAIRAGIGFVGEDRRRQGIVPDLPVLENLLLIRMGLQRRLIWSPDAVSEEAADVAVELGLPAHRLADRSLLAFSGGMQQKIILARSLSTGPRLLLLDEPTRGVDIETRSTIYRVVRERANRGLPVLWISSDFEELLGICDRVIVISDGRSVADLPSRVLDVEKLMMFAAPKSSSDALHVLLERLAGRFGGTAFWAYRDVARVYCFDSFAAGGEPLLAKGTVVDARNSPLGAVLDSDPDGAAVAAGQDDGRIIAMPVRTRRGHYFGHLGVALPVAPPPPQRDALVATISEAIASF